MNSLYFSAIYKTVSTSSCSCLNYMGHCLCSLLNCPTLHGYAKQLTVLSQYLGNAFEMKREIDTAVDPTFGDMQL